jgi:hypothetical protein
MSRPKKSKYEVQYKQADRYFAVNLDDEGVCPVYISLPKPPDIRLIDGYGLPPHEQFFHRLEIPKRLKLLEERTYKEVQEWAVPVSNTITGYKILQTYWDILTKEQYDYQEEIAFIKKCIWHTIYGYWCFINGKPTYLPPWYFCFLNFFYMPNLKVKEKYPEYRDDDRITELYKWYSFTTHETFKDLDKDGNAIRNNRGEYDMIELPYRTSFGTMQPKRRRRGETSRGWNNILWVAMRTIGGNCTYVAETGEAAKKRFKEMFVPAWQKLPMFLKPIWDGDNDPSSKVSFKAPSNVYSQKSVGSTIDRTESASERANDGDKFHGMVSDEDAKVERIDAGTRWGVNRFTMHQGPAIHGYAEHSSTVEEMTEGGEEFYDMWVQSNFYNRDANSGWTKSGLFREFIPAYRAYDKFIGPWGESVIDDPTEEQLKYKPEGAAYRRGFGARKYHQAWRDKLLRSKNSNDLKLYRERRRREPIKSSECWLGTAGDIGFPLEAIDSRLADLRLHDYNKIITGDFVWRGGIRDSIVDFIEKENGKFNVSLLLDRDKSYYSNQVEKVQIWDGSQNRYISAFAPVYKARFTAGADPIDFLDREPGKGIKTSLSDGGGAVFWEGDSNIENSRRFVCTYRNRPPFNEYCEDMIMMCRYYGAMMYFERNKPGLWEKFVERGYKGYLKHAFDVKTNTFKDTPGAYAQAGNITDMLNAVRDYLEEYCYIELHHDFLQECKEITSKGKLKKYDLLAACGWALEGSKSTYGVVLDSYRDDTGFLDFTDTFLEPRHY